MLTKEESNTIVNLMCDAYKKMLSVAADDIKAQTESDCLDPDEEVLSENLQDAITAIKNAINDFENYCMEKIV